MNSQDGTRTLNFLGVALLALVIFVVVGLAFANHPDEPNPPPKPHHRLTERVVFSTNPQETGINQLYRQGSGDFGSLRGGGFLGQPNYEIQGGYCGPRFDYLNFTV